MFHKVPGGSIGGVASLVRLTPLARPSFLAQLNTGRTASHRRWMQSARGKVADISTCEVKAARTDLLAAATVYLPPPRTSGGSLAVLRAAGSWQMTLHARGKSPPASQQPGGYRFLGGAELATAKRRRAAAITVSRVDAFMDFTVDAQPPKGLHYVLALSTDPGARFGLSMLGEGKGFFSLSLKLPGDVTLEDRSMVYQVGARVRAVISADFASGTGYLTQTGLVRSTPFVQLAGRKFLVKQLRLGVACRITLHEIAVFAR